MIGPMIPELSKRLGSAFRKAEVIHLSGTVNAHSNLEATLTCSFNFLPSFKQLGQALAARMVEDGITTAGLIYLTDDYGEKLADQISSEFTSRDGKITDISATQLGKLSYVPDITNALANSPEGLVLVSYPKTGSDIVIDSMMSTMKRPQWYFSPSLRVSDFIVNVPPGQLEGAVGVAPGLGDRAQVFRELYESLWSGSPLLDGYYYYDSILALSLAMAAAARENNGTPTWKAICENMQAVSAVGLKVDWRNMAEGFKAIANGEDVDYDGLAGPLSLDDQGDLVDGWLELWRIHDNKIITDSRHELTQ